MAGRGCLDEERKERFTINVRGYVVDVEYTPDCFAGKDHDRPLTQRELF
jgi:hypothetical protein